MNDALVMSFNGSLPQYFTCLLFRNNEDLFKSIGVHTQTQISTLIHKFPSIPRPFFYVYRDNYLGTTIYPALGSQEINNFLAYVCPGFSMTALCHYGNCK